MWRLKIYIFLIAKQTPIQFNNWPSRNTHIGSQQTSIRVLDNRNIFFIVKVVNVGWHANAFNFHCFRLH